MDGEIIQQRSSYRQGLVLGLTMAEIMLLLVFCLLIAMAIILTSIRLIDGLLKVVRHSDGVSASNLKQVYVIRASLHARQLSWPPILS
jgi:uncharacterized membrane protein